ncbi:MAG TPA: hypothetical protein VFM55_19255 [Micromonosporaceae bacterium]|nr:hypothetical protein [Micromonosporaceae bacterium]
MKTDPLAAFAAWPTTAEEATAEALIRYAAVRAYAALALIHAGHDVPRQQVRAVQYVAIATLLSEMHSEPARADVAARHLWARLGDGADLAPHLHAWVGVFGIDPEEVARAAVEAYEARAAEVGAQ